MELKSTRKHYIDNLRSLCILLLFPFHSAMIFVDTGEKWYVHGAASRAATYFTMMTYPWWMSGLFALAGISSVYALRHRTGKQYLVERVKKLLIPLIFGLILIVPVQTYISDIFYNGYSGNYFEHFKVFFTLTDFSGADGHFTPGHTWFILYLFVISIIALPILLWYKNKKKKINGDIWTIPKLLLLMIPIEIATTILNIGNKSVGEFMAYFLIGYLVLSEEEVQKRLEKNAIPLGIACVILAVIRCIYYDCYMEGIFVCSKTTNLVIDTVLYRSFSWIGILAMLGLGRRFLGFHTPITQKFAAGSFPIYLLHQSVIVIVGYLVLRNIHIVILQYILIVGISFSITIGLYTICKHFKWTKFMLGIK